MPILAFPASDLTPDDEVAILAEIRRGAHYGCRRDVSEQGCAAITLLDRELAVRGQVTKRHGVYAVLDPRGYPVVRTRRLAEILAALAK